MPNPIEKKCRKLALSDGGQANSPLTPEEELDREIRAAAAQLCARYKGRGKKVPDALYKIAQNVQHPGRIPARRTRELLRARFEAQDIAALILVPYKRYLERRCGRSVHLSGEFKPAA